MKESKIHTLSSVALELSQMKSMRCTCEPNEVVDDITKHSRYCEIDEMARHIFKQIKKENGGTMKFRNKPVVIEAERFVAPKKLSNEGRPMFMEWPVEKDENGYFLTIPTLEGNMRVNDGDWIITGIKGEKYPCKPDIFETTYEAV